MYYSCNSDLYKKLAKARISDISEVGLQRLDLLKKYNDLRKHNYTEKEALNFLGVRRSTFYLWQKKF